MPTALACYDAVNAASNTTELQAAVRLCAIPAGTTPAYIQGRTRQFAVDQQEFAVASIIAGQGSPQTATRSYGIRQQAVYLATLEARSR